MFAEPNQTTEGLKLLHLLIKRPHTVTKASAYAGIDESERSAFLRRTTHNRRAQGESLPRWRVWSLRV